jgi:hypothetical protein
MRKKNPAKTRSAWKKTLLALEHHARPLKEQGLMLFATAGIYGWQPNSVKGGVNSWEIYHDDGRHYYVSGRRGPWRIEIRRAGRIVANLHTRSQTINWAERNLP